MAEKEVTIKISAKNLTAAEFKKARKEIVGLGDATGKTSKKTKGLGGSIKSFFSSHASIFKATAVGAAAVTGAIVGVAAAVVKLGERGAVVADVQSAFDSLSVSVGVTAKEMLTSLQSGVKGTVSDFELMQVANKALGAGLLKTSSDAQTLSEGARLLAKRTGGDTKQAFETLVTAIASGRTAQLKQLGLFVDSKQAVEDYAEATGRSVADLNDADRATALQIATLAALRKELRDNAPPLADFGELIARAGTWVTNLKDQMAILISNSPPLLAGMKAVGGALSGAFGDDQQSLVVTLVNWIEKGTLIVIEFAQTSLTAADIFNRVWNGIKAAVLAVATGLVTMADTLNRVQATIAETAAKIPGLGGAFKDAAIKLRTAQEETAQLKENLAVLTLEAIDAARGQGEFSQSIQTAKGALSEISTAMVNAGLSQQELTQRVVEGKAQMDLLPPSINLSKLSFDEMQIAAKSWGAVVTDVTYGGVTSQEAFQAAMEMTKMTVGNVTTATMAAFERMGVSTRAELEKTAEQAATDYKTIEESGLATAEELKKAWEKMELARQESSEKTKDTMLDQARSLSQGAQQLFGVLGQKYKAAAIAGAIIATYQAIAKALASAPWPFSLVLAAGAAAAGFMNVSKIRSSDAGFQKGTRDLDFQDFGSRSLATLHGREAVIPRGRGHILAAEIADALGTLPGSRTNGDIFIAVDRRGETQMLSRQQFRHLERAMGDGVVRITQRAVGARIR